MDILIGVFGTSQKTCIKITDAENKVIGCAETEETNIHWSIKHAWDTILRGIRLALRNTDISIESENHIFKIGLGLKYTELVEYCIAFKKSAPHFLSEVTLKSDGFVLCNAAHRSSGAILILDEGMVGNAIHNNEYYKIGGWGFPHSDKGSFPWIGMEAVRLTLQHIDEYIEASPLLSAIHEHFDNNTYDLVHWAMHTRTLPDEYLLMCNIVLDYFNKNDKNAIGLIKKSADEAEKIYHQLIYKTKNKNPPICLYGLLTPYVTNYFSPSMKENITHPEQVGVYGALKLVR